MGYSARYHAASLAAVFIALAVGILIGAGLGGNLLNDTEKSLQNSLRSDLENARSQSDDLRAQIARAHDFEDQIYPILVGDKLAGSNVGVIALGDLSGGLSDDIQAGLAPTGANLAQVSVVRSPPNAEELARQLKGSGFGPIAKDPARLEALGRRLGQQLARGHGQLLQATRDVLLSRSSGQGKHLDRVVLVRATPTGDVSPEQGAQIDAFDTGIVEGVRSTGLNTVAVEDTGADQSSVPWFSSHDVSTVDDIDAVAGQVAMVYALLGANGDFGVKDSADRLLPELLVPAGSSGQ
ncbi:MAG: hypothetical protein QOD60_658 [Solirubrobacterales bacterium]|nr:hypothetical protein [Solirubrobacterales bacterium]